MHLADSVRDKLKKMVKKDSLSYKRLVKLFDQLMENPYAVGKDAQRICWSQGKTYRAFCGQVCDR